MKFINIVMATAGIAAFVSCATVSSPVGGPKDITKPTLINSNPQSQQLNVSTSTITLEFDEAVMPNSLQRELLITPAVETKYSIRNKKNLIELTFEKPLDDSTTYTFNFRKGVQDITEKNVAEGLTLTFSTGTFIDSSRVSGQVVDLMTQQPQKQAVVALYPVTDTVNIRKNRPYYQTETDETGRYEFRNVKEGDYRIFALVEKNNNAFYDNESEKIAYLEQPIRVTPQEQEIRLQTVRLDTKKPILLRRETYLDRFGANYNEGIKEVTVQPLEANVTSVPYKVSQDGKIVDLFKTQNYQGGRAVLTATDSAGNVATDTLNIAFEGKIAARVEGAQLKQTKTGNREYSAGQPVVIILQTPVRITSPEPITIFRDSVAISTVNYPEKISLDSTRTELTFNLPTLLNRIRQVEIALDSAAIIPLEGGRLRYNNIALTVAEGNGTGSIEGKIITSENSYIIELLNNSDQKVAEVRNQRTYRFNNLAPGAYKIRVLVDENENGIWEGGDPTFEKEPERVYVHPKVLDVRANWIMEETNIKF
ncbi:Ig-like domain-containing domain [Pontibacter harenae]|uniref:Ig-like domain-containing domain n=1 Tax=Pontibacter harenae TaxID=2894083 RepID=UPI001E3B7301|nr:Ig-like domain-containing domain [Pontibacter harenae]MCC9165371.1 Ig-like domain-containing protein [Pontibacter harenae]